MDKVEKLNSSVIDTAIETHKAYNNIVAKVTDRMNYVIRRCTEIAGVKLDWWDWQNDGDWEDQSSGDFMQSYHRDQLTIRAEWKGGREIVFIDKDGGEWGLADGIPTRWLYEDFEEEFTNGLRLYKEKEKQKAEKAKEKRLKDAAEQKVLR